MAKGGKRNMQGVWKPCERFDKYHEVGRQINEMKNQAGVGVSKCAS